MAEQEDKARILVVDDNPEIRSMLERGLSDKYVVIVAKNGAEAESILIKQPVDVLITDFLMPDISGEKLIELARSNSRQVPALVISGVIDSKTRERLFALGAVGFLPKPFSINEIKLAVENLLRVINVHRERNDKRNTAISTVLTHELRTPLVAISAGSEVLMKELADSPLSSVVGSIKKSGQRLEKLISNLTTFQQIQLGIANKLAREKAQITNFDNCITKAMRQIYEDILENKPVLIFKGNGFNFSFRANEHQVSTALAKILENSIKFNRPKPQITVEARMREGWIEVLISDNGAGFPEDYDESHIAAFYQPNRKYLEQQGSGLGLYIAKTLIVLNGGRLLIRNNSGAIVEVSFPALK